MPRRCKTGQGGYSLVELLVVMLIIGILAAIALPSFLGQNAKAQDAAAKSNARGLLTHVETCFTANEDYTDCDTAAELGSMNLDYGAGAGKVQVTASTTSSYTITATSKSGTAFRISKSTGGLVARSCTNAGQGGCRSGGSW